MAIEWNGDKFLRIVHEVSGRNLRAAAYFYQGKLREAISVANSPQIRLRSGRAIGLNPSKPGEPPRKVTGHYRRSIAVEVNGEKTIARVGSNLPYGKFLELGRKGFTIVAKPGSAIPIALAGATSKRGKLTGVIFRKRVKIGPMAPRPHLLPTLQRNAAAIGRIAAVNEKVTS